MQRNQRRQSGLKTGGSWVRAKSMGVVSPKSSTGHRIVDVIPGIFI